MRVLVGGMLLVLGLSLSVVAQDRNAPRGTAGEFDHWMLSLSWSPAFCAGVDRPPRLQCGEGRRFGFVVHGLWPQYDSGSWPQFCNADRQRRDVDQALTEAMLPVMPSPRLIEYQWDKHGTCSGLGKAGYFSRTVAALKTITIPPRFRNPDAAFRVSVSELEQAFATVNPGLSGDMIAVRCRRETLREVRICFDKELAVRPCADSVRDTCRGEALVRPVR